MKPSVTSAKRQLRIAWCDQAWRPEITWRAGAAESGASRLPAAASLFGSKPLKYCNSMKRKRSCWRTPRTGFTLVELLVVIAIIAILAAMLLPAVHTIKVKAQVAKAKLEINKFLTSASQYESDYSRMPMSQKAVQAATDKSTDFTYGGTYVKPGGTTDVPAQGALTYWTNNSEVVSILMDLEYFGNGIATINKGHVKNTKQTKYLNPDVVSDTVSPGVGKDGVFRDVWGQPYIISFDVDDDSLTRDAFYASDVLSYDGGTGNTINGLVRKAANDNRISAKVAVWSLGPDKTLDPAAAANLGKNKDNVLSWKP